MRIPVEDVVHGMQLKGIPVKEVRVCKQMAELIGRDKVCGVPVVVVNVRGEIDGYDCCLCAANGGCMVRALAAQEWFELKEPEGRLVLVSTPIPGQRDLYAELVAKDRAGITVGPKNIYSR